MFGLIIPYITAKITTTHANLKTMTLSKQFPGFGIVHMHNQNAFRGFRVIPLYRVEPF